MLELACGIGQILREVAAHGVAVAGIDVVFAKLWLARHFLLPDAPLVCADVTAGLPLALPEGTAILCHDAFYFMPEQERIAASLMAAAGERGSVLIGHAHNIRFEHGIAGRPRTPEEYAALFPGCRLYDDAELAHGPAPARTAEQLATVEAVSLAWSAGGIGPTSPIDFHLAPARHAAPAQPAARPRRRPPEARMADAGLRPRIRDAPHTWRPTCPAKTS